jgi:hypothetical protein
MKTWRAALVIWEMGDGCGASSVNVWERLAWSRSAESGVGVAAFEAWTQLEDVLLYNPLSLKCCCCRCRDVYWLIVLQLSGRRRESDSLALVTSQLWEYRNLEEREESDNLHIACLEAY